jgi:Primase X
MVLGPSSEIYNKLAAGITDFTISTTAGLEMYSYPHIPISDYRKLVVWRILAPYLINVKKLSDKESFDTINQWLLKCNELRRLDFNPNQKIKEGLGVAAKGYYPISLGKLKEDLPALYDQIYSHSLTMS